MESYTFDTTIKNDVQDVVFVKPVKKLTIKRFWDSHGTKVWWKDPEVKNDVQLKIIRREYDIAYGKDVTDPNKFRHWVDFMVYVDDKKLNGEFYSGRGQKQVTLTICDGHG